MNRTRGNLEEALDSRRRTKGENICKLAQDMVAKKC
jgi:hypothetical protein